MASTKVLDRFVEKNPLAVMARCIIDSIVSDDFDELFEEHSETQFTGEMMFSTLVRTVSEIALGTIPNRNQAYRK